MSWARLDDAILDNPKIARAGVYGFALHVAAITWCCRNLTDGFIPYARVTALLTLDRVQIDTANPFALTGGPRSMAGDEGLSALDVAEHLVDCGLWEPADGGYLLHDFLDYNPSKAEVLAKREGAKDRTRRSRNGKRAQRVTGAVTQPVTRDSACDSRVSSRLPDPDPQDPPVVPLAGDAPPLLDAGEPARPKGERKKPARSMPDGWKPNEKHHAKAGQLGLNCEREAERFENWTGAKGMVYADWDRAFLNHLVAEADRRAERQGRSGGQPVPARQPLPEATPDTNARVTAKLDAILAARPQ